MPKLPVAAVRLAGTVALGTVTGVQVTPITQFWGEHVDSDRLTLILY